MATNKEKLLKLLRRQQSDDFEWIRAGYQTEFAEPTIYFVENGLEIGNLALTKKLSGHFPDADEKSREWGISTPEHPKWDYWVEIPLATHEQLGEMAQSYIDLIKKKQGLTEIEPMAIMRLKQTIFQSARLIRVKIQPILVPQSPEILQEYEEEERKLYAEGIKIVISGKDVKSAFVHSIQIVPTLIGFFDYSRYLAPQATEYGRPAISHKGVSFLQTFMKKSRFWYLQYIIEDLERKNHKGEIKLTRRNFNLTHHWLEF